MVQPSGDRSAQHRSDLSYERPLIRREMDPTAGWLEFSVVLLVIAGSLNLIAGIGAIGDSKFFVRNADYVIGSLHTWGWTAVFIGAIQILTALGIWRRNQLARWVGVLALALNSVTQLLMIPAAPFWSLAIFALDIVAIYGLIAYGRTPASV
jgi:hypothetical protein